MLLSKISKPFFITYPFIKYSENSNIVKNAEVDLKYFYFITVVKGVLLCSLQSLDFVLGVY